MPLHRALADTPALPPIAGRYCADVGGRRCAPAAALLPSSRTARAALVSTAPYPRRPSRASSLPAEIVRVRQVTLARVRSHFAHISLGRVRGHTFRAREGWAADVAMEHPAGGAHHQRMRASALSHFLKCVEAGRLTL